ncbi:amidohydrolase family protein [Streptomyces sp. NBC_00878]|uniref:amidohydrolase family protein n=1 Tax=Streptomyces sp. NBC_00878 TaxID=2975854 RepID=UPI00224DE17E|nr:amidohydrolase family protein [Streptomyces sp. NBC_00878]
MKTVDVHAHVDAPEVSALVHGRPGLLAEQAEQLATFGDESTRRNVELAATAYRPLLGDLDCRLARMDRSGIDVQALSVIPTLYHYWAEQKLAAEIVEAANTTVAGFVKQRPDRFVGLATVALQHPEAAAEQLGRAMGALGMRGVEISTNVAGRDLSDRSLDPFWAAAEELDAFVFIHPWGCTLGDRLVIGYLGNVVGNPTETTLALHHLVFGGVFDRFPRLRVCGAHGGGYFPHYLGRADHAYDVRPESRTMRRRPSEYLDHIYFDSLVYTADNLARLVTAVGADRVVIGTDYPFDMAVTDPLDRLAAISLTQREYAAIAGATATRLLGPLTG